MFSNHERQKERTGRNGTPRDEHLQDLVTEFQHTVSEEAKEQIVANLGNFAYDPLNYEYLRKLHVLDLFMDCLTEPNEKLVEFGVGGICNCSPDPANAAVLIANGAIPLLISCLSSPVENTVLSSMTSLYYLCTHATRKDILIPPVVESLRAYASSTANPRFQNVAKAFLDKYVEMNQESSRTTKSGMAIPYATSPRQGLTPNIYMSIYTRESFSQDRVTSLVLGQFYDKYHLSAYPLLYLIFQAMVADVS